MYKFTYPIQQFQYNIILIFCSVYFYNSNTVSIKNIYIYKKNNAACADDVYIQNKI